MPIGDVAETMRPLPIEPFASMPAFVLGVAVIRGRPTPVVDAGALVGAPAERPTRFVTIKTGARTCALAVDSVIGIGDLATGSLEALPALLDRSNGAVSAIGAVDAELLVVLESMRIVPAAAWEAIARQGGTS